MNNENQGFSANVNPDGTVNVAFKKGNGTNINKLISIETFAELMQDVNETVELPLLPSNIKKFRKQGDIVVIAIEVPESEYDVKYNGNIYKSVVVPRSLWIFRLRSNPGMEDSFKILKTYIFTLTMPLMSEDQDVYDWPFPNYSQSYSVCWGNDQNYGQIAQDCKLRNLNSLPTLYFSANFNDDLGFNHEADISDHGNLFRFLAQNSIDRFESSWLQRCGTTRSFNDALEYVIGGL